MTDSGTLTPTQASLITATEADAKANSLYATRCTEQQRIIENVISPEITVHVRAQLKTDPGTGSGISTDRVFEIAIKLPPEASQFNELGFALLKQYINDEKTGWKVAEDPQVANGELRLAICKAQSRTRDGQPEGYDRSA